MREHIGGIFERYLYISTSLYGAGWLLRPVVLGILVLVAWALFRPLTEIARSVVAELRQVGTHKLRISASAMFTVAIMVFIIIAILLSNDWPAAALNSRAGQRPSRSWKACITIR